MPLIRIPDMGLNGLLPPNALDLREAAEGSQNLVYEYGLLRSPYGFAKLDLTSGLNSGDTVLAVFQWRELDDTTHLMAKTTEKIYEHDRVNSDWDDRTQSGLTMLSDIEHPISYAEVGHDDTAIYLNDNATSAHAYHHVIVCDGGMSNIQRWAGKWEIDFADLVGAGGYHDSPTHRALQVSLSKRNRLILISPQEYDSATAIWTEQNQVIKWPTIGKIETWTGTGSGFSNLLDTGGVNVWSAPLGSDHIIYQTKGIWSINYVGGSDVFYPVPLIPDLGLLSYRLLCNYNNVHYFLGTDYNVHAYYGGTVKQSIGDKIQKYLESDMDSAYNSRCHLVIGERGRFLWIFIVPSGSTYAIKSYKMNMVTKAWMVRDYSSKWTSGGISAVCLAGAGSYIIGDTYATALNIQSAYDISNSDDVTQRYGDVLCDTSRTLTKDYTAGVWSAGGYDYSLAAQNFAADITKNDVLVVFDGSTATNTRWGTHFYTVYDVSTNGFSLYGTQDRTSLLEHGIADTSVAVPADLSVSGQNTIGFYSACSNDLPGATYNQKLRNIQIDERIILGDNGGYVYQVDETYTADDNNNIDQRHLTPVIDWDLPGEYKRWPGLRITAKGTTLNVRYRTASFDTSDTGWSDITQTLTSEWLNYEFPLNVTSKKIQWSFKDFSGDDFQISDMEILEPLVEENR